jgi:hypothetical protein
LNAICPDGFKYGFVDEEFVVGREFGLESEERASNNNRRVKYRNYETFVHKNKDIK